MRDASNESERPQGENADDTNNMSEAATDCLPPELKFAADNTFDESSEHQHIVAGGEARAHTGNDHGDLIMDPATFILSKRRVKRTHSLGGEDHSRREGSSTDTHISYFGLTVNQPGYELGYDMDELMQTFWEQEPVPTSARLPWCRRIPACYLLIAFGVSVIVSSLVVGLYYSIAEDRMGDGFTTAGFMVAVGTLICAAPMARHYPKCRCWDGDEASSLPQANP